MLKYKKLRKRIIYVTQTKATDVLYQKMHVYNNEAKHILGVLLKEIEEGSKNTAVMRDLYRLMDKADSIAIDCAHKLAPYQSPKLESIEVRNKIEHRYVLRAPQKVASVEEWAKLTGAEQLKSDEIQKKAKEITPPAPSLHDFDEEEDEINTNRSLN